MLRQLLAWVVVALAVVAIAGGLGFYKYKQIEAAIAAGAAYPEPVEAVSAAVARKGKWQASARAIGTVVALQQVEIRNEIAGVVNKIGFKSGESVKAGQVLIELDTRQEEASLAAAEAEVRLTKQTLERRQGLRNSPAFSEQEFDKARSENAAAIARARNLTVAIDKKRITAPFDGVTGITDLQPGAYLDVGTRITMLQGSSPNAYVDFSLPQDEAAFIKRGTSVTLHNVAIPGGKISAEIVAEENAVDRASRTVTFRAMGKDLGRMLRPGMFIDVMAVTAPEVEAVFVPLTAVRRSPEGTHVFALVEEDGKLRARQRRIVIGPVVNSEIAVLDGLEAGQRIASSGSFKLREGALVATSAPQASAN